MMRADGSARADRVLLLLLALSLSTNVFLAWRVVKGAPGAPVNVARGLPQPGTKVSALLVHNAAGELVTLGFDESPMTVVYVFSPFCKWCDMNMPSVRVLMERAARGQIRLIGISLVPDVNSYVAEQHLDFPIFTQPSIATRTAYAMGPTPQTFVIGQGGWLKGAWNGAYVGTTGIQLGRLLGVSFPDLMGNHSPQR